MAIPTPVSFWNLDESSGNAADAVGSNTLTNANTVTYSAGKIGNGAVFVAASSQALKIANASQNPNLAVGGADFSLACWFKLTSFTSSDFYPLFSRYDLHERSFRLGVYGGEGGGSSYLFNICDSTGETSTDNIQAQAFSTATWYHVAISFVFSTTTVTYYHNGSSIGTDNTTYGGAVADTSEFDLGANVYFGNYSNMQMDMAGIWNSALSAQDVSDLYNGGTGVQYPFATPGPANLKSLDTNVKANIKSIDTNLIANVKTFDTNV